MRLYKTSFKHPDPNQPEDQCAWDGTQADAAKTRGRLKGEKCAGIETKEVDVPTDKKGLLEFLNQWAVVL